MLSTACILVKTSEQEVTKPRAGKKGASVIFWGDSVGVLRDEARELHSPLFKVAMQLQLAPLWRHRLCGCGALRGACIGTSGEASARVDVAISIGSIATGGGPAHIQPEDGAFLDILVVEHRRRAEVLRELLVALCACIAHCRNLGLRIDSTLAPKAIPDHGIELEHIAGCKKVHKGKVLKDVPMLFAWHKKKVYLSFNPHCSKNFKQSIRALLPERFLIITVVRMSSPLLIFFGLMSNFEKSLAVTLACTGRTSCLPPCWSSGASQVVSVLTVAFLLTKALASPLVTVLSSTELDASGRDAAAVFPPKAFNRPRTFGLVSASKSRVLDLPLKLGACSMLGKRNLLQTEEFMLCPPSCCTQGLAPGPIIASKACAARMSIEFDHCIAALDGDAGDFTEPVNTFQCADLNEGLHTDRTS
eukprot:CAMPEP_0180567398 /NCGR_PEP_ID=MMETSP1037_2-20121125/6581_1 /TAXON_ID=632150 /ORGANISM="Azadinium spinosum, Strain 3D9" /LENGTH=417 /DNA_ID=CAMNT_0022584479 /DNA_START=252 /DNA_END=1504 /DNA_ORIENTATION=-